MSGKIYIAKETFASAHVPNIIRKDVTRVREGHILLQHHPELFSPLGEGRDGHVDYEVDAVREPTVPAQVKPPEPDPDDPALDRAHLDVLTRHELEELAAGHGIESPGAFPNKAALVSAIAARQ